VAGCRDGQLECEVVDAATTAAVVCRERRRRTRDVCRPLRHWMYGHRDAPYPSRADKLQLATDTQLSLTQVPPRPRIIIAAHSNGQAIIFLPCGFFFLSFFSRLISAVAEWMSTILLHMVWP